MNDVTVQTIHDTRRLTDITGPENTLILLASPGDEATTCGGFISEACARGRPPFVVILGDGAPDGSAQRARAHEQASRTACALLGLPDDRLLFVGLRQSNFPAEGAPLFNAVQAAMTEVSWRRDCNVILAPFADAGGGDARDGVTGWRLACALARDIEVPLLASVAIAALTRLHAKHSWRLDLRQWEGRKAEAGLVHGYHIQNLGYEIYSSLS